MFWSITLFHTTLLHVLGSINRKVQFKTYGDNVNLDESK